MGVLSSRCGWDECGGNRYRGPRVDRRLKVLLRKHRERQQNENCLKKAILQMTGH